MLIFNDRLPNKEFLYLGVKKDNKTEDLKIQMNAIESEFLRAVISQEIGAILSIKFESSLITDREEVSFYIENNCLFAVIPIDEKYTTAKVVNSQFEFDFEGRKWQTKIVKLFFDETIDTEVIVDKYPRVLQNFEERLKHVESVSVGLDEEPTEDSENAVMSGGVFEAIKQAKFTAEIIDRQIVIEFADGSEIKLNLPAEVVSGEVAGDEIVLTLDSGAEIRIDLSTVLSKKLDNLDGNIVAENGELKVNADLRITGDIIQQGEAYETHAEHIYTKQDKIILREEANLGLLLGETAGLVAKKYDGLVDGELSFGADGIARVGDVGDTQPLATREENPTDKGIAYWEDSESRFKTSSGLTKEYLEGKLDKTEVDSEVELPVRIKKTDGEFEDLEVSLSDLKTSGEVLASKEWVESIEVEVATELEVANMLQEVLYGQNN